MTPSCRSTARLLMTLPVLFVGPLIASADDDTLVPAQWEYSRPLIGPETRDIDRSHAQKDPTVVFHDGRWHVFMTVKLQGRSAIEHCSFKDWDNANRSKRTILTISDSDYYCAPQVFYFTPHRKWYLVYQMGVPGQKKMWVACSTTEDITDPHSWTQAAPSSMGDRMTRARSADSTTGSSATTSGPGSSSPASTDACGGCGPLSKTSPTASITARSP